MFFVLHLLCCWFLKTMSTHTWLKLPSLECLLSVLEDLAPGTWIPVCLPSPLLNMLPTSRPHHSPTVFISGPNISVTTDFCCRGFICPEGTVGVADGDKLYSLKLYFAP